MFTAAVNMNYHVNCGSRHGFHVITANNFFENVDYRKRLSLITGSVLIVTYTGDRVLPFFFLIIRLEDPIHTSNSYENDKIWEIKMFPFRSNLCYGPGLKTEYSCISDLITGYLWQASRVH